MPSQPQHRSLCVLVVEDDEGVRQSLELLLGLRGFDVRICSSLAAVRRMSAVREIGLLVTDYDLPDGTGLDVLAALLSAGWRGRAVMITAKVTAALIDRARASGFHKVLEKPMERDALIRALIE